MTNIQEQNHPSLHVVWLAQKQTGEKDKRTEKHNSQVTHDVFAIYYNGYTAASICV